MQKMQDHPTLHSFWTHSIYDLCDIYIAMSFHLMHAHSIFLAYSMGPVGSEDVHHAFLGNKDTHEGSRVTRLTCPVGRA